MVCSLEYKLTQLFSSKRFHIVSYFYSFFKFKWQTKFFSTVLVRVSAFAFESVNPVIQVKKWKLPHILSIVILLIFVSIFKFWNMGILWHLFFPNKRFLNGISLKEKEKREYAWPLFVLTIKFDSKISHFIEDYI